MDPVKMLAREDEILDKLWNGLNSIPNLNLLAANQPKRLGIFSFYIDDLHYNLAVRLLNDRFGIQVRGGCSCAGTYGHYLLHVDQQTSDEITNAISSGDLSSKPGWVRLSIHPTMLDSEVDYIIESVRSMAENFQEWAQDYEYSAKTNEYAFKDGSFSKDLNNKICKLFEDSLV